MKKVEQLKVKIFADGAEKAGMLEMAGKVLGSGADHQPHVDAQGRHLRLQGFCQGHPWPDL